MKRSSFFFQALLYAAGLAWLAPRVAAQVTYYADEGNFNAATSGLRFIEDTFENIAPAGGQTGYAASSLSQEGLITYNWSIPHYDAPQDLLICDAAYKAAVTLDLNGSAYLLAMSDGVNFPTVTMEINAFQSNAPATAFGVTLGFKNPYGGDNAGYDPASPDYQDHYPLTDTIDIQLYNDAGPVGDVYHLPTTTGGFIGFISTQPFTKVSFAMINHVNPLLYGPNGYPISDPYEMVFDNARFSQAPTLPTVTVVGASPNANTTTGQVGDFVVTLSAPAATDLKVRYTVKGTAQAGVDYVALSGKVKLKAGQTSKKIAVVPLVDPGGAAGKKVLKLTLQPGTGYLIGTPDPVKLKIFSDTAN